MGGFTAQKKQIGFQTTFSPSIVRKIMGALKTLDHLKKRSKRGALKLCELIQKKQLEAGGYLDLARLPSIRVEMRVWHTCKVH